ncbi:MAG: family 43 glycosylhydrolase [Terracidiphilus sp.]|nr:family 43 glycosylhydrolase [Terracidiphilus sp.]
MAATLACTVVSGCHEREAHTGWEKSPANPVLGGALGTCFDVCVLKLGTRYRMYFSWRPRKSIAIVESNDGIHWEIPADGPRIVLGPSAETQWEGDINRPTIVQVGETYHLWYTGQTKTNSAIGHAVSKDGLVWTRANGRNGAPVLTPLLPWEGVDVMTPDVLWEPEEKLFKMWYSAGEQYEPNAIGYATSTDGQVWSRNERAPIFAADPQHTWEKERVTAPCIVKDGGYYYAFYIGFKDIQTAAIGVARSRDGITNWERYRQNPIVRPPVPNDASQFLDDHLWKRHRWGHRFEQEHAWDGDACYRPSVLHERGRWMLWYNGRRGTVEQIGVAIHRGDDLGF